MASENDYTYDGNEGDEGDEGNEGNEGIGVGTIGNEGDEGDEGDEGNAGIGVGTTGNEEDERDEGDEGNEGNEEDSARAYARLPVAVIAGSVSGVAALVLPFVCIAYRARSLSRSAATNEKGFKHAVCALFLRVLLVAKMFWPIIRCR